MTGNFKFNSSKQKDKNTRYIKSANKLKEFN